MQDNITPYTQTQSPPDKDQYEKSPRVQYHPSRVTFSCRLLPSPEPLEHIDLYLLKAGWDKLTRKTNLVFYTQTSRLQSHLIGPGPVCVKEHNVLKTSCWDHGGRELWRWSLTYEREEKGLCRAAVKSRPIGSSSDDTSLDGSADMFQMNIRLISTVFLNAAIPRSSVLCCRAAAPEHTEIKQTAWRNCWQLSCSSCVLLPEDPERQLWPLVFPRRWKWHLSLVIFIYLEDWLARIHAANSGDKQECARVPKHFPIRADYIHKSCFHFSGGKKMLLSRPISSSYCVAT